jgi:phosphodiesterase/alkaline phosphatase D-like protein
MKDFINRRIVLGTLASAVLTACNAIKSPPQSRSSSNGETKDITSVYLHGVASGDPSSDSLVIWTRISVSVPAPASPLSITWELSESPQFSLLTAHGKVVTNVDKDFTVKATPAGLKPGKTYYYRFIYADVISPIGRTKTLRLSNTDRYGIALASCSNFAFGYFNAYDAIAKDPEIDLVLHTGDYIYEYGADGWGADTARTLGRVHQPAHEITSLNDYRLRHAQYKTDLGSQAMHAAHPMVCCWDDHESANNPWLNGAQNHQENEGDWSKRRAASVQAYYEWMPIRDPGSLEKRLAFSRVYKIGNLANLVTLETRHTARAQQIDYQQQAQHIQSPEDAERFKRDVIGAANRPMLSSQTETLVTQTFDSSASNNQPWRLLGNASPIARMLVPDVEKMGILEGESSEQLESNAAKELTWKGKHNLPFYTDTWDGYPWARQQFYQACQSVNATDMIFLTGDSHSFWMNQLADDNGISMGVELGTAGVSSPGDFVDGGWRPNIADKLDRAFEREMKEVVWTDNLHQGYVKLKLTHQTATASFIAVSTILEPNYTSSVLKRCVIERSNGHAEFAS